MKKTVYASHYFAIDTGLKAPQYLIQYPYARRFSPIQKSVFEAFESIRNDSQADFDQILKELKAPLYFATSVGEIDSVTKVIGSVLNNDLPVSPTAFQHSVHNAAAGHISIYYGLRSPQLTFSSGFLSLDKALFNAFHKISSGLVPAICVFAASEYLKPDRSIFSRSEICFLSDAPLGKKGLCYEILDYNFFDHEREKFSSSEIETNQIEKMQFKESKNIEFCGLKLMNAPNNFVRSISDLDGESLTSRWNRML